MGGGLQQFVFPCPACSTQLKGEFFAEQPTGSATADTMLKPFQLRSDDFELLDYERGRETSKMLAVAVDTEIPVHISMFSMPVTEIRGTPFIYLAQQASHGDAFLYAVEAVNRLRELRFVVLPPLRRAAVFYAAGDMQKLGEELRRVPGYAESELTTAAPWKAVSRMFDGFLDVIGDDPARGPATEEFFAVLDKARKRDADATRAFLEDYLLQALPTARRTMVDTFVAVFSSGDSLVPGLYLEAIPELEADEYRIQRSDFDAVKGRYQDIFELASRILVLPAGLANIGLPRRPTRIFGRSA